MNKIVHAVIVLVFAIACWFLSGMLYLVGNIPSAPLPAFTRLCVASRPLLFVLPLLALAYCLFVCFRKTTNKNPWIGFFATTMAALVLVMLPTMVAAYLPLIDSIHRLASK